MNRVAVAVTAMATLLASWLRQSDRPVALREEGRRRVCRCRWRARPRRRRLRGPSSTAPGVKPSQNARPRRRRPCRRLKGATCRCAMPWRRSVRPLRLRRTFVWPRSTTEGRHQRPRVRSLLRTPCDSSRGTWQRSTVGPGYGGTSGFLAPALGRRAPREVLWPDIGRSEKHAGHDPRAPRPVRRGVGRVSGGAPAESRRSAGPSRMSRVWPILVSRTREP